MDKKIDQKGFANVVFLVLAILIIAGVGVYFVLARKSVLPLPFNTEQQKYFDTTNSITVTCEKDNFCTYSEGKKITKCTDTDGGENLFLRGKIQLYDSEGNPYIIKSLERATYAFNPNLDIYEDACLNDTELIEYVCNIKDVEDTYKCPKGCQNGACVK